MIIVASCETFPTQIMKKHYSLTKILGYVTTVAAAAVFVAAAFAADAVSAAAFVD